MVRLQTSLLDAAQPRRRGSHSHVFGWHQPRVMTKRLKLSTGMMRTNARLHADQPISRDYENVKAVAEAMVERDPNVLCCIKRHAQRTPHLK